MKIQMPSVYHITAVPPGKRKASRLSMYTEIAVHFPEATAADAPVVARWTETNKYVDEATTVELRLLGEKLYRQRSPMVLDTGERIGVRAQELVSTDLMDESEVTGDDNQVIRARLNGGRTLEVSECRGIEWDDLEETTHRLRAMATDMLLIDGEVWEPAMAPVIALDLLEQRGERFRGDVETFTNPKAFSKFLDHVARYWEQPPILIGADRLELLQTVEDTFGTEENLHIPRFDIDEIPVGLCGHHFERDVVRSSRAVLETSWAAIRTCRDQTIHAWMELRKSAEELERCIAAPEPSDEAVDAVFEGWRALSSELRTPPSPRLELLSDLWDARIVTFTPPVKRSPAL